MAKTKRPSKEERRAELKARQGENVKNKDNNMTNFGAHYLNISGIENFERFKPNYKKVMKLDIIPYIISTKNHPQKMKIGYEDYLLDIFVHKSIGADNKESVLCLKRTFGKPCPICEEAARLKDAGDDDGAKNIKPKRRVIYNVINTLEDPEKITLLDISHFFFEKELLDELKANFGDDELPIFSDLEDGLTIKCRATEEKYNGNPFPKFKSFGFEKRDEAYDEEILERAFPLDAMLNVLTYDEVSAIFYCTDEDEDDDDDELVKVELEKEDPKKVKRKAREAKKLAKQKAKEAEEAEAKDKSDDEELTCPHGHTYAEENMDHSECDEDLCDCYDACSEACDNL